MATEWAGYVLQNYGDYASDIVMMVNTGGDISITFPKT